MVGLGEGDREAATFDEFRYELARNRALALQLMSLTARPLADPRQQAAMTRPHWEDFLERVRDFDWQG
jgi:hypothetical protein